MGKHQIDPKLGTIDLTPIETHMHKKARPLTPKNKHSLYGLLSKEIHLFFMATMGIYRRNIVSPKFVQSAQGAGCLVRDYSRNCYALRVYDLVRSTLLAEEELSLENIIFIDEYKFMLLIVLCDGNAFLLEFIDQSEVHSMHSVIDDHRTKSFPMRVVKRPIRKGLEISKPQEAQPVPKLLKKSDIFVISEIHQKPKREIKKTDISGPSEFIHVQHGGCFSKFTLATDNSKLLIKSSLPSEDPNPITNLSAPNEVVDFIENTIIAVPIIIKAEPHQDTNSVNVHVSNKGRMGMAPPPPPPNGVNTMHKEDSIIRYIGSGQSPSVSTQLSAAIPPSPSENVIQIKSIATDISDSLEASPQLGVGVNNGPPPPPLPPAPLPPPPPPMLLINSNPINSSVKSSTTKQSVPPPPPQEATDFQAELMRKIQSIKERTITEPTKKIVPATGGVSRQQIPQTISEVLQMALEKMRNAKDPNEDRAEDVDTEWNE